MKENAEIKICKNKNCKKVLPEGYKYNRCEACRNQLAQNGKNILPVLSIGLLSIVGFVLKEVNPKK